MSDINKDQNGANQENELSDDQLEQAAGGCFHDPADPVKQPINDPIILPPNPPCFPTDGADF